MKGLILVKERIYLLTEDFLHLLSLLRKDVLSSYHRKSLLASNLIILGFNQFSDSSLKNLLWFFYCQYFVLCQFPQTINELRFGHFHFHNFFWNVVYVFDQLHEFLFECWAFITIYASELVMRVTKSLLSEFIFTFFEEHELPFIVLSAHDRVCHSVFRVPISLVFVKVPLAHSALVIWSLMEVLQISTSECVIQDVVHFLFKKLTLFYLQQDFFWSSIR